MRRVCLLVLALCLRPAPVLAGQLGLAGGTGRSPRPHPHFGVWALGRHVDPGPLFLYDPIP